jgi:hypothetical protein
MGREIQKKIISKDILFTDDFDESMLDEFEGDPDLDSPKEKILDFSPDKSTGGEQGEWGGEPLSAGEPREPPDFERDLPSSEFEDDFQEKKAPAESSIDDNLQDDSQQQEEINKRARSKKIQWFLAAASVLFIVAGGVTYLLWPGPKAHETPRVDIVRHRIVIPDYEHEINFLIFSRAQGKEDLLKLDLELDFNTFGAHKQFKEKQAYYTDFIYGFLRKQSPPDNSVQDWAKILEQDLPERLKNDYPEIRLNSIRMKNFHRL